jgi:GST-like protein
MATWPWYGGLLLNLVYDAAEFLDAASYPHVLRWAREIAARPAVVRGVRVNRTFGPVAEQLRERHSAADFDR